MQRFQNVAAAQLSRWLRGADVLSYPPMKTLSAFAAAFLTTAAAVVLAAPKAPPTLEIGAEGPDFSLEGVDGETYSLESFADAKAIVLVFTCNHCPDAVGARDRIQQMAVDYKPKGVELVAISGNDPQALQLWELGWSVYGDSFDEMKALHAEEGWTFPYLYDGDEQQATSAYGAIATPHVFILDGERKLRYHGHFDDGRRGEPSNHSAKNALDEILAGEPVTTPTTRVFGCSTKWSWKRELAQKKSAEWAELPVTLAEADAEMVAKLRANKGGKLRLINVWATDCGPCVAEFPDLVDAYRRYQRRGFSLVTISMDDPDQRKDAAHTFLKKKHAALSPENVDAFQAEGLETNNYIYRGNPDALAEALDPEWQGPIPYTVLLDGNGEVLWRHQGQVDAIEMRRAIVKAIRAGEADKH